MAIDNHGFLSEHERLRTLRIFDTFVPQIPARKAVEVDRELFELREARRAGGRRTHIDSGRPRQEH